MEGVSTPTASQTLLPAMQTNLGIPNIDGQYIIGDSIAESVAGANAATIDPQSGLAYCP